DVLMPKLSDTMEEGKILRWLKRPGERVEEGDLLVEVETDKADMEIEATATGVLREVRLDEGESGRVGDVIAVIDDGASQEERAAPPPSRESATGDRKETRAASPRRATGKSEQEGAEESTGTPAAAPKQTRTSRAEHPAPRAIEPARAASRPASGAPK